jgi:hypothetical protein
MIMNVNLQRFLNVSVMNNVHSILYYLIKKTSITQHTEHQHAKRRTGTAGASVKTSREETRKKRLQQHT